MTARADRARARPERRGHAQQPVRRHHARQRRNLPHHRRGELGQEDAARGQIGLHVGDGRFSQGGTCTTQLVPRHPDIYGAMLPVDGELKPTNGSVAKMVQEYFAGDRKAYDEQVPVNAIASSGTSEQALFTGAGERDKESISNMRTIAAAARKAGHGGHRADRARRRPRLARGAGGLAAGLDWFGERTGLGEMAKSLKEYPQVEVLQ